MDERKIARLGVERKNLIIVPPVVKIGPKSEPAFQTLLYGIDAVSMYWRVARRVASPTVIFVQRRDDPTVPGVGSGDDLERPALDSDVIKRQPSPT